jgi:hypothetical protein
MKTTHWRDRNAMLANAAKRALVTVEKLKRQRIPVLDIQLAGRKPTITVEPCRAAHKLGAKRVAVDHYEAHFCGCRIVFGLDAEDWTPFLH